MHKFLHNLANLGQGTGSEALHLLNFLSCAKYITYDLRLDTLELSEQELALRLQGPEERTDELEFERHLDSSLDLQLSAATNQIDFSHFN